jgi:hypothetical protein
LLEQCFDCFVCIDMHDVSPPKRIGNISDLNSTGQTMIAVLTYEEHLASFFFFYWAILSF